MIKGFVSLVGAGPGDPGLLTLSAREKLREADLVIYDYLVNPEHLRHLKIGCERVSVGKGFRHKKISQNRINQMIIAEAKKGKRVVRLKGGDPYLFGRGGEEALFLKNNRIPFDVVPGVTSFTACAAYAGIPMTHRDHNASVTLLTGHRANDQELDSIDWSKISELPGAIAIYMGLYNLPKICQKLIQAGKPGVTPVAVIEWGTLPKQRVCEGNLKSISEIVQKSELHAPCMIIIGDVVKLRAKLNWFEQLPLFGKKILVTRSQDKASVLSDKLKRLGASTFEMPVIQITPPASWRRADIAIENLYNYSWVIFTSAYGVDYFLKRIFQSKDMDARVFSRVKIACVGPETARALRAYGLKANLIPKNFDTNSLAQALLKYEKTLKNKSILLARTRIAPKALENKLKALGAAVNALTVYETQAVKIQPEVIKNLLKFSPDYLTFTSSSSVTNLINILGKSKFRQLTRKKFIASIGPVTSNTLRNIGFPPHCQAKQYHLDGLVEALKNHQRRNL